MDLNLAPDTERLLCATRALAGLVSQAVQRSVDGSEEEMGERKQAIRTRRLELESDCVHAIAEHRPVGDPLVQLTSIIHLASDLERTVEPVPAGLEVGIPESADLDEGYRNLVAKVSAIVRTCSEAVITEDASLAESALKRAEECIQLSDALRDQIRERMQRNLTWIAPGIRLLAACGPISRAALILERTAHRTLAQSEWETQSEPGLRRQSRRSRRLNRRPRAATIGAGA